MIRHAVACSLLRPLSALRQKMAMEEGEARGRAEGLQDGIAVALRLEFGEAGRRLFVEVSQINDVETLKRVTLSIETAVTIDDVRRVGSA